MRVMGYGCRMADRPSNPALRRTAARVKAGALVELPADGNPNPAPPIPEGYPLLRHGELWWQWAWTTPESTQWGDIHQVARRAQLEDEFAHTSNRVRVSNEMRQMEKQLGLTPEAKKQLGWIVKQPEAQTIEDDTPARSRRLRVVDGPA